MPGGEIDDAQAPVNESRTFVDVGPGIVRSAMREDIAHCGQTCALVEIQPVGGDDAGDAAHG
jgi:hypothetical protein